MKSNIFSIFLIIGPFMLTSCLSEPAENLVTPAVDPAYKTENVILVVIDGPRYSETWADNTFSNIPHQKMISEEGVFFDNFHNDGVTFTLSGHTAITTGIYEEVKNNGIEVPSHPSVFQYFLSYTQLPPEKAWIVTSKSKLRALADTKDTYWRGSYVPRSDAVDRFDAETYEKSIEILNQHQPSLAMIHFRGPDRMGHRNDWNGYIEKIRETDRYVWQLWDYIQSNEYYINKTTLLVTCDHGRHLNGIGSGFIGHGDNCRGCQHIYLLAVGPDFKNGSVVSKHYGQIDISPTIATLMNIPYKGEGQPISELINP